MCASFWEVTWKAVFALIRNCPARLTLNSQYHIGNYSPLLRPQTMMKFCEIAINLNRMSLNEKSSLATEKVVDNSTKFFLDNWSTICKSNVGLFFVERNDNTEFWNEFLQCRCRQFFFSTLIIITAITVRKDL